MPTQCGLGTIAAIARDRQAKRQKTCMVLILQKAWRSLFRYGQKFYRTESDRFFAMVAVSLSRTV
jgi:hypothetical protein